MLSVKGDADEWNDRPWTGLEYLQEYPPAGPSSIISKNNKNTVSKGRVKNISNVIVWT